MSNIEALATQDGPLADRKDEHDSLHLHIILIKSSREEQKGRRLNFVKSFTHRNHGNIL